MEDEATTYKLGEIDHRLQKIENGALITQVALLETTLSAIQKQLEKDKEDRQFLKRTVFSMSIVLLINIIMWCLALAIR